MKNYFCSSLSRFALPSAAALTALALSAPAFAADTIAVFDVGGTALVVPSAPRQSFSARSLWT
jgi:hypothetical protein